MLDISQTIAPKSDQLNSDDLIGGAITICVTNVSKSPTPEQPINISYKGDCGKPYKPCKSMRRVLVHVWGKDGINYIGRAMTLHRDERVIFGGVAVGGIRISHMTGIKDKVTIALTMSKTSRKPYTVLPLTGYDEPIKAQPQQEEEEMFDTATPRKINLALNESSTVDWVRWLKEFGTCLRASPDAATLDQWIALNADGQDGLLQMCEATTPRSILHDRLTALIVELRGKYAAA